VNWDCKNVLVTGSSGFLGSHLISLLKKKNIKKIITPRSQECDLRKNLDCKKILEDIDIVFHLAGMGNGIGFIKEHPGTIFYNTILMDSTIIEESRKANVEKIISASTLNVYPHNLTPPFNESDIWVGFPEEIIAPFGIAKRLQIMQSITYRKEYNFNSTTLILSNLYGSGDNFNLNSSNVIPSLILKIFNAKINHSKKIELWGNPTTTRDFLHVEDAANAFILTAENSNTSESLNIASGVETSIFELVNTLMDIMDFKVEIIWNKDKPIGASRRALNIDKAKSELKFTPKIDLLSGLKETIDSYQKQLK
jgi:nucleoside-diphosphate-sugar epimerase